MPPIINAHAHSFTIDHVPDKFTRTLTWFSALLTIKRIKNYRIIRWLIFFLNKKFIKAAISFIAPALARSLPRLLNFAENFDVDSQRKLIDDLRSYYPADSQFVILSMDMDFMAAGKPFRTFQEQLDDLAECKKNPVLRNLIFPFVFADPRRNDITEIVKNRLENAEAPFAGVKLYPALGYYPFDKRLKEIFLHCIENNIPLLTHCTKGSVYYRGKKNDHEDFQRHPITKKSIEFKKAVDFTAWLSHPYNFECLMNKDILSQHWGETIDLKELRICFGHFGGEEEWIKFLEDCWLPDRDPAVAQENTLDIMNNQWFDRQATRDSRGQKAYSWFSVICEMIHKYDNVYADISYTLSEPRILPLLKVLLQTPGKLSERILFGTDYYVVSKAGAEREMSLYVRGYLGDELFWKMMENGRRFLERRNG